MVTQELEIKITKALNYAFNKGVSFNKGELRDNDIEKNLGYVYNQHFM